MSQNLRGEIDKLGPRIFKINKPGLKSVSKTVQLGEMRIKMQIDRFEKKLNSGALAQSVCQALPMLQTRVRIQARVRRINSSFLFFQCSNYTDV